MRKIWILSLMVTLVLVGCQETRGDEDTLALLEAEIDSLQVELDVAKAKEDQYIEDIEALDMKIETLMSETLTNENFQEEMQALKDKLADLEDQMSEEPSLLEAALEVLELLEQEDLKGLAAHVDPESGLTFSPYGYIDQATSLTFTPGQVGLLMSDQTVYQWGIFDGSGEPIEMTYPEYHASYVYDQAFVSAPLIGQNTVVYSAYSNLEVLYPDAQFVSFHFKGFDPAYEGLDWVSLRLVFKYREGQWKLVHIIHDQWTI